MNRYIRVSAAFLFIAAMVPYASAANAELGASSATVSTVADDVQPRSINPKDTDRDPSSTMDAKQSFGNHLVWPVDRSQAPGSVEKSLLYLFMGGTGSTPGDYLKIQREAMTLGYHVIGLAYPNTDAVVHLCNDPRFHAAESSRQDCYLNMRLETVVGTDVSTDTQVDSTNSIENRLTKLLVYLHAKYPDEGWGGFLDDTGSPKWSRIVVAGHSQGGGDAALIGKLHLVARVVMISSPPDGCFDATDLPIGLGPGCTPFGQPANWLTPGAYPELTAVTPIDRYYGLAHVSEFAILPMLANWGAANAVNSLPGLGLGVFGTPVIVDAASSPSAFPYKNTHMLMIRTELNPNTFTDVVMPLQDHRLTARDTYIDKLTEQHADSAAALQQAWRYINSVR
jgi:hypothetical protein